MSPARILILVVAIAAAGGTAIMMRNIIASKESEAVQVVAAPPVEIPKAQVLVAAVDMPMGYRVRADDFEWRSWPKELVPDIFITEEEIPDAPLDLSGAVVRSAMVAEEPIMRNKMVKIGDSSMMSLLLRKGMRAVAISVSAETTAGGFILPSDRVDVLVTRRQDERAGTADVREEGVEPGQGILPIGDGYFTETVLENVKVLAIDQAVSEVAGAEGEANSTMLGRTATLELTPAQAELISLAEKVGELSLALRSYTERLKADGTTDETAMPVAVGLLGKPVVRDGEKKGVEGAVHIIRGGTVDTTKAQMSSE